MTVATVLPFVPAQWFTSAGDAVLAGGMLEFYEVGTTTPKTVYSDYEATTPHAQPVVLSASGKATVFLGAGGYKVVLKDALGAVMDTVDGIFGDPSTANGGSLQTGVATFDDLRAFTNPGAVVSVLVAGALTAGDGGGGIFTFNPAITTADDGGIIIAPDFGAGRWVRSVSGIPSITWWGIKALTTENDDTAIANAFAYCNARNSSLIVDRRNVGLRTNATFSGSKLIFSGGNFYTADVVATLSLSGGATVQADAHDLILYGSGGVSYGAGQVISPEWTSAALDDSGLLVAINAAGANPGTLLISSPYTITGFVSTPDTLELVFAESGRLNFAAAAALTIGKLGYVGREQIISYDSIAHVGAVSINAPEIFPEWFGAVADGVADDSVAFYAAAKTGRVNLASAGNYLLGPLWGSTPTPLTIKGGTVTLSAGKNFGSGVLTLDSTRIAGAFSFTGTAFQAFDSEFSPVPASPTALSISGCKVGSMYPFYAGTRPTAWGLYTDVPGAQILGTSAAGKLEDRGNDLNLGKVGFGSLFFSEWITAPTLTGTVSLTNPLYYIYQVDNISTGVTINLPSIGSSSNPNLVIFVPLGGNTITINGTIFGPAGDVSTFTVGNRPIMLYCNYSNSKWHILSTM